MVWQEVMSNTPLLAVDLSWSMYKSMSVLIYNFLRIMINLIALKWIVVAEMYVGRAEQKSHDFFVYAK